MQKKIRRKLWILLVCAGLCITSIPAYAQTVDFNITVTESARKDPISKRAMKADTEQQYYVTVTSGVGGGVLRAHSERIDAEVISASIYISRETTGQTLTASYYTKANAGAYYFLNAYWSHGYGDANIHGRYTP